MLPTSNNINQNTNSKYIQASKIQAPKIQVSNLQVKIMRHPETGSARIIMRREKTMRVGLKEDSEHGKFCKWTVRMNNVCKWTVRMDNV